MENKDIYVYPKKFFVNSKGLLLLKHVSTDLTLMLGMTHWQYSFYWWANS